MAINLYGPATTDSSRQVDSASVEKAASAKTEASASNKAAPEDTTAFSSDTATVNALTKTALEVVPSRQAKVEALKQAVNSAQYQLDADKIAASIANADV